MFRLRIVENGLSTVATLAFIIMTTRDFRERMNLNQKFAHTHGVPKRRLFYTVKTQTKTQSRQNKSTKHHQMQTRRCDLWQSPS